MAGYEHNTRGLPAAKRVGEVQIGSNGHKHTRSEASSSRSLVSTGNGNIGVEANNKQDKAQNSIGRFFYENGVDFSSVDSPSFKETLKAVQDHVKEIKDSWEITGCSILLDAWVDQKGHDLVTFVADSPAGPVYLISFDVSDIKHDLTALIALVNRVIEDVGVRNVIQIIASSTSGWVGELSKLFVGNKRQVFWSVSLSHCIELMLIKIGEMDSFGDIFDKVGNIWEFIRNKPSIMKVFRDQSDGIEMITTEYDFVMPYLMLESILKAKNDLVEVFANKEEESTTISKLVSDSSFWVTVKRFVKSTSALVHGSLLLSNGKNHQVGYVYDTMDRVKQSIAWEFSYRKLSYKPIWDVIDDVWNKHLHSPLHAAGYFLKPALFYSNDFHLDQEVSTGLISSLVRMVKESHIQTNIATQLDVYRQGEGCFNEASQADQIYGISPTEWWGQKGSQYPELQSLAIKVLSQTCEGASRYKLKRSLTEKLMFTEGMSRVEKQHLEFVHYNLHLQSCKDKVSQEILLQDVYMD